MARIGKSGKSARLQLSAQNDAYGTPRGRRARLSVIEHPSNGWTGRNATLGSFHFVCITFHNNPRIARTSYFRFIAGGRAKQLVESINIADDISP